ncbi:cupin domain-containing protein [Haloarcula regularis]|uniref:cupin domain-containing protein n=1 Tax=Haloarcula regularis TaxID=3033392 RepID=UPI00387E857C
MNGVLPPGVDSGPARLHPRAVAHSAVVAGRADVTVGDETHSLLPGESLTIAVGEGHSIRNSGTDTLVVRTTLRPPGEFEAAIRALYDAGAGPAGPVRGGGGALSLPGRRASRGGTVGASASPLTRARRDCDTARSKPRSVVHCPVATGLLGRVRWPTAEYGDGTFCASRSGPTLA